MNSIAFGLPLHPLVVHVAVVLLPLGALGLIAAVISARARRSYGWLIMGVLTVGSGAAIVAKFSGEQLAKIEPLPERHSDLGNLLVRIVIGLMVVAWGWWLLWCRRSRVTGADRTEKARPSIAERALGVLVVPLALAAVVFTGLTGHAGAQATWGAEAAAAPNSVPGSVSASPAEPAPAPAQSPDASPTAGPAPEPTPTEAAYSLQEVAEHDSATSCWVAIDGAVYDVTLWIERHPGGRQRILNLCGTDGTSMFRGQHGSAEMPNDRLAGFRIGQLS